MSLIPKFLIIFLSYVLMTFSVYAQNNSLTLQNLSSVSIDKITDEEIENYYFKAKDNGITDEYLYRILTEKGLPQEEIIKLKTRIGSLNTIDVSQPNPNVDKRLLKSDTKSRYSNQDANSTPRQTIKSDLAIFGSELFATSSMVFEPNLRIPTPAGYILGPDDELIINVFGYSEKTYNVTVNEEGSIYIPQVGPIFVNGLSIDQATAKIKSRLASTIYKAINNGQTTLQVSLGKIKSIRVTVIGEAKKPGTYTVSSLTSLFNLLYFCGGPSELGSYRKIELIRANELKRTADLYAFLLQGNQQDNVLLQEGDVIRIPFYKTRILLNGNVRHKGKYELTDGETFDDVLKISGGFSDDAYKAAITVYQLTETERKIIDLAQSQFSSYKPLPSDSIVVGKLLDNFSNKLIIKGAINRPGEYELTANLNLKDLIKKSGGVKDDVYSKRGSISRLNPDKTPVQLSFDIDSVLNNTLNIPLKKNDEITLYSIFDLKNDNIIIIDGYVKRPGNYQWSENITLKDIILKSGGLTLPGDITKIEISRVVNNKDLSELNYRQAEILKIDLSDSSKTNDIILKPFDIIHIRQQAAYSPMRVVLIEGQVNNPGSYTLKMSGDRVSDLIMRAGGFRPNADTSALIIRRISVKSRNAMNSEQIFSKLLNTGKDIIVAGDTGKTELFKYYDNISVNLNNALHSANASENLVLEDGDIISIERNTNLVKVSGEVYFPTIISFKKNANLKYYIQKSGSYSPRARKKGALVIYPDGKAKKVKSFLFFKIYPEVVSRSEIFVPQKSASNKVRVTVGEWAVVLSSLAIIANVIINMKK